MNKLSIQDEEVLNELRQNCESLIARIHGARAALSDKLKKEIENVLVVTNDLESNLFVHNYLTRND